MTRTAALLATVLVSLCGHVAHAEVVERVVAVVNDAPVFLSDLRRRAVPFLEQAMDAPTEPERMARLEQLYSQLLDQLIDEQLIKQAARRAQVSVTSAEVDTYIRNVQQQSGRDEAEFWDAIGSQGLTRSDYRSYVRSQLLRLKVINQRVRGRVNITDDDVRRQYDAQVRELRRSARFQVSHVFFGVEPGASATELASIRRTAEAVRASLTPETFEAAITAHAGGDLGWVRQGDLPEALEAALLTLEPDQISAPVRGPNGFHVFWLRAREEGGADVPSFESARQSIHRRMLEEAMERQERVYLDELRRSGVVERRL